jgi:dihydrofolate synthase/folylpolyglutamate synthase
VFFEDFDPAGRRILVVGCLQGRDPREMLSALRADEFDAVLTCTAPSARGMAASELTRAARAMGCEHVLEHATIEHAIDQALAIAEVDDAVLITGSLYVVGGARPYLRKVL